MDTNVLVSAFLSSLGTPGHIMSAALRGQLQACYNQAIIDEYEEVLSKPKFRFELSPEQIQFALKTLQDAGVSCNIYVTSVFPMIDESDRVFYDVAKVAGALLITGNMKHYPSEPFIVTPRDFMLLPNV